MKKGDIYFSKKNERGQWQQPEPVEGELNNGADEGIVSFTPDGQTMYLTKARRSETSSTSVEIYTSRRSGLHGAPRRNMRSQPTHSRR